MKNPSLGFIGGGRITRIFLQALKNKGYDHSSVVVCDSNLEVLQDLKKMYPKIHITDANILPASQKILFIALHPPAIPESLAQISGDISGDTVIVSLAPKITIEKIEAIVNHKLIVRMIPNATSYINEGYNPYSASPEFKGNRKEEVLKLVSIFGHFFEVPEAKLESYAILSAMLPTYFWFQWKELTDIGMRTGLSEQESRESIRQTLSAAINLMFSSGLTFEEVVDLIPVRPLADHEEEIRNAYRNRLIPLYEKLTIKR